MSHPHPELNPPQPPCRRWRSGDPTGQAGRDRAQHDRLRARRLTEPPDFLARGFEYDDTTFKAVIPVIEKTLAKAAAEGIGEEDQLEQLIHRTVSRWAHGTYRRSPIILPIIIDA